MRATHRSEKEHASLINDLRKAKRRLECYKSSDGLSELNKVVGIDPVTFTVKAEANATMDSLVQATLPFGFLPAVLASCRNTTVASAFAAQSSESSSFAFGTFDDTVVEVEMIMHDGKIVYLRPENRLHHELFYGSANVSFCPGLLTMFELCLVRAGPYVEIESQLWANFSDAEAAAKRAQNDASAADFVEMLVSKESSEVLIGRFAFFSQTTTEGLAHLAPQSGLSNSLKGKRQVMTTSDYVFRNDNRLHGLSRSNSAKASLSRQKPPKTSQDVQNAGWALFRDFGVLSSLVQRLIQQMMLTEAPVRIWLYPILTPEVMGRRLRYGIGCASHYGVDLSGPKSFCYDNMSLEKDLQCTTGPSGWQFLSKNIPCKRGTAWFACGNRWCAVSG